MDDMRARIAEDLGTVTGEIRHAMTAHGVQRMWVAPFEARPHGEDPLPPPAADALAALNTHDMPTFAAFWSGVFPPN